MTESVIDFPKDSLCPEVWEKAIAADGMREVWQLKQEARAKIQQVYEQIAEAAQQHFDIIHITGSIASNSYTENADIDVHFLADENDVSEERAEQANKLIRAAYKKKMFIGKHLIEVYFQANKFQDLMSVGCYDFFAKKWLVGPEMADASFNPYSEYYHEIQAKSEELAQQIRNMIFSIYEIAVVMKKNIAAEFGDNIRPILVSKLEDAQQMYDSIRQMRKAYSSPASEEQALEYRASRKWKVADGVFKLFDKYGYMAILKQFIEDCKLIQSSHEVDIEVVDDILNTVKHYINNADKLAEEEIFGNMSKECNLHDAEEHIDEGAKEAISMSLLAALLAIPGIAEAKAIHKTMKKAKMEQRAPVEAVDRMLSNTNKIGDYTEAQIANAITRTLYNEAQEDGNKGLNAVASVIFNRAEGNISDFVNVCKKKKQFSCWNKMTESEWLPENFKVRVSKTANSNSTNMQIWENAKQIASDMVRGKFKPTTNANAYYAPKKVTPAWDKDLKQRKMIGSHLFGILTKHSEFV